MILKGKELVIFDDLIIDVAEYTPTHPGGEEVINSYIGRDISKFFYGGYAGKGKYAYAHS
jgi:cytochrome b involved in lipid metabolism